MKLATENTAATVVGAAEQGAFKIKSSAKAFSILSSGLYSDKILAIVRELSCNAYDSHVEAGAKDKQFDVHLPNSMTPEFYVRDYGVGLDHEGVMNVYTTYFESTKQDSNDYIGALGLGSKSPFSYTDNFTVTAIKNGVKRIYSAMVEEGIPTIVKMGGDIKTSEANGVEVKFAVKKDDMQKFADAARKTYKWFSVVPNIKGNRITVTRQKMAHTAIVPGVDIRAKAEDYREYKGPLARQGNVVYPLKPDRGDIDKALWNLLEVPLVIDFPIGSLDVAASREELSYISHTNANINARLHEIQAGLTAYVNRHLTGAKTEWEKLRRLSDLLDDVFGPIVKGFDLKKMFTVDTHINYNNVYLNITTTMEDAGHFSVTSYGVRKILGNQTMRLSRNAKTILRDNTNNTSVNRYELRVRDGNKIFINDTDKKNVLGRVRKYCADNKVSSETIYVVNETKKGGFAAFDKVIGNAPVIKCSELDEPVTYQTRTTSSTPVTILRLDWTPAHQLQNGGSSWYWKAETESLKNIADGTKTLYVPLRNKTVIGPKGDGWKSDMFYGFMDGLVRIGIVTSKTQVIGVRKSVIKNLTKHYVNLFDVVKEEIKKIDVKRLNINLKINQFITAAPYQKELMSMLVKDLGPQHEISKMYAVADNFTADSIHHPANIDRTCTIARRVGVEIEVDDTDDAEKAAVAKWKTIEDKYPLMRFVDTRHSNRPHVMTHVADYIKLVDKTS